MYGVMFTREEDKITISGIKKLKRIKEAWFFPDMDVIFRGGDNLVLLSTKENEGNRKDDGSFHLKCDGDSLIFVGSKASVAAFATGFGCGVGSKAELPM